MADYDPRITPARPDLAAFRLKGQIEADVYASGQPMYVSVPMAPMTASPDAEGEMTSQLLFGEPFNALELEGGWAWGQSEVDGYVGYIPDVCLSHASTSPPSHRIIALQALIYPDPQLKSRPVGALPYGALVTMTGVDNNFASLDVGGWVPVNALRPVSEPAPMWVTTAERFKGAPYLWGGRSPAGFDCSGLIQVALQSAGVECPRDSDLQMAALGREISQNAQLRRGDIVFWKGHVGVMISPTKLLHANAHHMEVAEETFESARARIAEKEFGEILMIKRITQ
ncbi:MAG: NlpC/P60 family protein [Pikeienuella sp.]